MSQPRPILLALALCWLTAAPASAQFRSLECEKALSQKDAEALIDRVQRKYAAVSSMKAAFHQYSYLAAVDQAESSWGSVWFAKPGRMKWLYQEPEEQVFLVRDGTLWFYQKADKQVLIHDLKEMLLTDVPVAFLMGIGDLRKDFKLRSACRNQEGAVLDLVPGEGKKAKDELQGFKLLIDSISDFARGAEIVHVGGNSTSILLSDIAFDPPLEKGLFEPAFPPGTDINDTRVAEGAAASPMEQ